MEQARTLCRRDVVARFHERRRGACPAASAQCLEQSRPPDRPRPAPYLPDIGTLDREEDDLGAADQVLERHVAYVGEPAVFGILAIVTHHGIVTWRDGVDRCGVGEAMKSPALERAIGH